MEILRELTGIAETLFLPKAQGHSLAAASNLGWK